MTEQNAPKKQRSPAYPGISLEKAIELARLFADKEGNHRVHADVAIKDMGYSAKGSPGMRALAALIAFGLLESDGSKASRKVWLTNLAKSILYDKRPNSPERQRAIQEAALKPDLHVVLNDKYPGSLPSDGELETFLVIHLDFNRNTVGSVIQEVRDTFGFAKLSDGDILSEVQSDGEAPNNDKPLETVKQNPAKPMNQPNSEIRDLTVPLIGRGMAVLRLPIPLSKENYEHIVAWFKLMEKPLTDPGAGGNQSTSDEGT
jgi:hypothetical protein